MSEKKSVNQILNEARSGRRSANQIISEGKYGRQNRSDHPLSRPIAAGQRKYDEPGEKQTILQSLKESLEIIIESNTTSGGCGGFHVTETAQNALDEINNFPESDLESENAALKARLKALNCEENAADIQLNVLDCEENAPPCGKCETCSRVKAEAELARVRAALRRYCIGEQVITRGRLKGITNNAGAVDAGVCNECGGVWLLGTFYHPELREPEQHNPVDGLPCPAEIPPNEKEG